MKFEMGRNANGLRVVRIKPDHGRRWSIQTCQNLPKTHHYNRPDRGEIYDYVLAHGTVRQIHIMLCEQERNGDE